MRAAVELRGVTKRYGRVEALLDVSLEVPEGALYGIVGPNGAGKTTLFGLLSGFLHPTQGEVWVRGERLSPGRPPVGRILALPQDAQVPESFRALEVLAYLARLSGHDRHRAMDLGRRALLRVGLEQVEDKRVGQLSHGQRRRIGIAQALLGTDEVIVLDEPTAGLDPRTALEIAALIRELHRDRTILLSSHNLHELETLCTHAAIFDKGRLVAKGTMDEIRGTAQVLHIAISTPAEDPESLLGALRGIEGVRAARMSADGRTIAIECAREGDADRVTGAALTVLIERSIAVKGVERGKRLEERFMEETSASRAPR